MFLECLGSLLFTLLQGLGLGMPVACGVWAVRRFGRGWKGALPPLAAAGGRAEMAGQLPQSGKDPWWQGFFLTSEFIDIQYLYIVFQMR